MWGGCYNGGMAEDEDAPQLISRGKQRRAQQERDDELRRLAERLLAMRDAARERLPLDEDLAEALRVGHRIPAGTGHRRQMRLVVQLLREGNPAPIVAALSGATARVSEDLAERTLQRLVEGGDSALQAWMQEHPGADRTRMRQWLRTLQREQEPPSPAQDKARRAALRYLQQLKEG